MIRNNCSINKLGRNTHTHTHNSTVDAQYTLLATSGSAGFLKNDEKNTVN